MKHEWNKTQIKALKSSILHWERMKDDELGYTGASECACCIEYNTLKELPSDCESCPLSISTGKQYCYGTPYWDAAEIFDEDGIESREFKKASQEMINFMNKVLKSGIEIDNKGEVK